MNSAKYGVILTTSTGFALYTYTADDPGGPGCTGECLKFWPPLLLPAGTTQPIAGTGVSQLGTFARDGRLQVTFKGLPLYTYITDKSPGQITGQNVVDGGGKWLLAIVTPAAAPASTTTTAPAPAVDTPVITPATEPATTRPPVTKAPVVTAPPATSPPTTAPPVTSPPSTTPPTSPPTTAPPGGPSY